MFRMFKTEMQEETLETKYVELPCQIGDEFWYISECKGVPEPVDYIRIEKVKVSDIKLDAGGIYIYAIHKGFPLVNKMRIIPNVNSFKDKEEAMRKLGELIK